MDRSRNAFILLKADRILLYVYDFNPIPKEFLAFVPFVMLQNLISYASSTAERISPSLLILYEDQIQHDSVICEFDLYGKSLEFYAFAFVHELRGSNLTLRISIQFCNSLFGEEPCITPRIASILTAACSGRIDIRVLAHSLG